MKTTKLIIGLSVALLATLSVRAQSFQNLNFELAHPVIVPPGGNPYYPYAVTATSALPDWTVDYGNSQQLQVILNNVSTGATQVTLLGPGSSPGFTPIDGNYSMLLQDGATDFGSTPTTASISQMGLIPAGTQSLYFEALQVLPGPGLSVSIGGQSVPFVAVATGPNYTLYGANISEWAGDPEELTFSTVDNAGFIDNSWEIDDISFSTTPVPEPSTVALTAISGLLFGARKWLARR